LVRGPARTVKLRFAVCVKAAAVPVNVTVDVVVVGVGGALRVVVCAVPGVRLRVKGVAVTPPASPPTATDTVPVKELIEFAVTVTGALGPPPASVSEVGETLREKSGGVVTATETVVLWLRLPEVPVSVSVAVAADAVEAAVRVMFCAAPGVRIRAEGCAVTPAGRPAMVRVMVPVKLFIEAAETASCWAGPPGMRVTVDGVAEREKSA
jgi:hypothetical protein